MSELKNPQTKWKQTDNRFVAFLDLLGFKDKIARKSHNDIFSELSEISRVKRSIEKAPIKVIKKYNDCDVYIVSFSDSIALFSKNDTFENFEYFLTCLRVLFSNSIRNTIALKGGIAYGEISINKSEQIYFGQAIIDAFNIEEDVNYLGVVAHNSIDHYIVENIDLVKKSDVCDKLLLLEKTPLKCGKILHTNLDYFILTQRNNESLSDEETIDNIINHFLNFYETVSGSPRRYIDNTIDFLRLAATNNKINLKIINHNKYKVEANK